jgi:hypothetical protein
MSISCPKCAKNDAVQSVSAILSGENFHIPGSLPEPAAPVDTPDPSSGGQAGKASKSLLQQLTFPKSRAWDDLRVRWHNQPGKNFLMQEYLEAHPAPGVEPNPAFRRILYLVGGIALLLTPFAWILGGGWITGLIFIAALLLLGLERVIYIGRSTPEFRAWDRQKSRFSQQLIPNLQRQSQANLQRAYYCQRDQVVFIPETGFCYTISETNEMSFWIALGLIN